MRDDGLRYELTGFPRTAIHFVRAMDANRQQSAAEHGLSNIEFRALFRIAETGSLTPKQLADDLGVTNGAITGLSDRLITAGLLRREAHPNDRRSLYLTLSSDGHQAIRAIHAGLNEMLAEATKGLDDQQLASTEAALRLMTESMLSRHAAFGEAGTSGYSTVA